MRIWKGMKWVALEGIGLGVSQRFGRLIFRRAGVRVPRTGHGGQIWHQFLGSATTVVQSFGPPWARRKVLGRVVGVWVLVLAWIIPPLFLILATFQRTSQGPRGPGIPPVAKGGLGT